MPEPSDTSSFLERIDATLTAGYAQALQLEAERWRLERRLAELAAGLESGESGPDVNELVSLSRRLSSVSEQIAALRTLLSSLRDRRTSIRKAA